MFYHMLSSNRKAPFLYAYKQIHLQQLANNTDLVLKVSRWHIIMSQFNLHFCSLSIIPCLLYEHAIAPLKISPRSKSPLVLWASVMFKPVINKIRQSDFTDKWIFAGMLWPKHAMCTPQSTITHSGLMKYTWEFCIPRPYTMHLCMLWE